MSATRKPVRSSACRVRDSRHRLRVSPVRSPNCLTTLRLSELNHRSTRQPRREPVEAANVIIAIALVVAHEVAMHELCSGRRSTALLYYTAADDGFGIRRFVSRHGFPFFERYVRRRDGRSSLRAVGRHALTDRLTNRCRSLSFPTRSGQTQGLCCS